MNTVNPKIITKEEIAERFDMSPYDVFSCLDHERIIFYDGDATIAGDLSTDWTRATLEALGEDPDTDPVLVMVNGNLTVEGDIVIGEYHPLILVMGNVYCDVLQSADEMIHITGDAHIKYAFYGYYNDGSITIDGKTYVPYVLNSDHHSSITPVGAILINTYGDRDDFFEYDYTEEVLKEVLVPACYNAKGNFDAWNFIDILKTDQSPFKEGAKPTRIVFEEELERITSGNVDEIFELNWSEKKVKEFPASITRLKNLKKLDLSKNKLSEIPAIIGELKNLEELILKNNDIRTISEAIGNCKNLRVLDLNANHHLEAFPDAIGDLESLQVLKIDYIAAPLPESMSRLDKLEEISMYQCYKNRDIPASFPEVLTRLKNLKRWDFRDNTIRVLPESILNIQMLEEFRWTDGLTQNHLHNVPFPDFTRFTNLKKLVISKKFNAWKEVVFNIPTLEHLAIDRNKEEKEYFDQDTIDIWTSMLADSDEATREHIQWMLNNKQVEPKGRFSTLISAGMKWEELQDIHKLQNLKYLDLSFNDLTKLPDTFYQLQRLEYVDLRYNKFPEEIQTQINQAFPNTQIRWKS
ncbi:MULTISPECIES: leucine-rich repeat domain-containing protein [Niastella]|uniref:Leucine-rich repeat domain-containing protein n=1 Tax=Niastella soli TaxID=2821487 RepID=A0ABS3YWZ6_9BACT|nr:leucine-rich repeat domain-containing protein [Niastella soli]MBO9202445.1 leucine-rich repeat domain-containing protein [Niastella soli]